MKSHLEAYKLISIEQHGFVSSKACITNLLECQDIKTQCPSRAPKSRRSLYWFHEGIWPVKSLWLRGEVGCLGQCLLDM